MYVPWEDRTVSTGSAASGMVSSSGLSHMGLEVASKRATSSAALKGVGGGFCRRQVTEGFAIVNPRDPVSKLRTQVVHGVEHTLLVCAGRFPNREDERRQLFVFRRNENFIEQFRKLIASVGGTCGNPGLIDYRLNAFAGQAVGEPVINGLLDAVQNRSPSRSELLVSLWYVILR